MLSELFHLTQSLIRKLIPTIDTIPVWWYIIGIPATSGLAVNVRFLGTLTIDHLAPTDQEIDNYVMIDFFSN